MTISNGLEKIAEFYKMAKNDDERNKADREALNWIKSYQLADIIEKDYLNYYNFIKKTRV